MLLVVDVGEPVLLAIVAANIFVRRTFFHCDGESREDGGLNDDGANSSSDAETTVASFLDKRGSRLLFKPVIFDKKRDDSEVSRYRFCKISSR